MDVRAVSIMIFVASWSLIQQECQKKKYLLSIALAAVVETALIATRIMDARIMKMVLSHYKADKNRV